MTKAATERPATRASSTGRTTRFRAEMSRTATMRPPGSVMSSCGSSQAVSQNAMTLAMSATSARLMSAPRPQPPMPQELDLCAIEPHQSSQGPHAQPPPVVMATVSSAESRLGARVDGLVGQVVQWARHVGRDDASETCVVSSP